MTQRKLLGWNPTDPDSTAARKLCKLGLIREDNGIPKLYRGLLIISDPHCFLRSMLKGWRSSSSTAIPKGMEIVDNSSSVLLSHFGHISCSCSRIVFHRSLDSTESPLCWLWTTWVWWSAFLAFTTIELHQHSVHCGERRFWGLEVFCYLPLTWTCLWLSNNPPSGKIRKLHKSYV